jgi:hypothetical protein
MELAREKCMQESTARQGSAEISARKKQVTHGLVYIWRHNHSQEFPLGGNLNFSCFFSVIAMSPPAPSPHQISVVCHD